MSAVQAALSEPSSGNDRRRILVAALAMSAAVLAAAGQTGALDAVAAGVTAAVAVVLAAVDIRRRVIPNRIVLPATAVVLLLRLGSTPSHAVAIVVALLAIGASMLALNLVTRSGIGRGDVKFALLMGAALGWGAVGAIMLGFLAIFPVALAVVIRRGLSARRTWLPFGPFLAAGTLVVLIVPSVVR
jgi:prepilin signal peptidase PulO-like enzyme (type II secretory pathway)